MADNVKSTIISSQQTGHITTHPLVEADQKGSPSHILTKLTLPEFHDASKPKPGDPATSRKEIAADSPHANSHVRHFSDTLSALPSGNPDAVPKTISTLASDSESATHLPKEPGNALGAPTNGPTRPKSYSASAQKPKPHETNDEHGSNQPSHADSPVLGSPHDRPTMSSMPSTSATKTGGISSDQLSQTNQRHNVEGHTENTAIEGGPSHTAIATDAAERTPSRLDAQISPTSYHVSGDTNALGAGSGSSPVSVTSETFRSRIAINPVQETFNGHYISPTTTMRGAFEPTARTARNLQHDHSVQISDENPFTQLHRSISSQRPPGSQTVTPGHGSVIDGSSIYRDVSTGEDAASTESRGFLRSTASSVQNRPITILGSETLTPGRHEITISGIALSVLKNDAGFLLDTQTYSLGRATSLQPLATASASEHTAHRHLADIIISALRHYATSKSSSLGSVTSTLSSNVVSKLRSQLPDVSSNISAFNQASQTGAAMTDFTTTG